MLVPPVTFQPHDLYMPSLLRFELSQSGSLRTGLWLMLKELRFNNRSSVCCIHRNAALWASLPQTQQKQSSSLWRHWNDLYLIRSLQVNCCWRHKASGSRWFTSSLTLTLMISCMYCGLCLYSGMIRQNRCSGEVSVLMGNRHLLC